MTRKLPFLATLFAASAIAVGAFAWSQADNITAPVQPAATRLPAYKSTIHGLPCTRGEVPVPMGDGVVLCFKF